MPLHPTESDDPQVNLWLCDVCGERFGKLKTSLEPMGEECPNCLAAANRAAMKAKAADAELKLQKLAWHVERHRIANKRPLGRDKVLYDFMRSLEVEIPESDLIVMVERKK